MIARSQRERLLDAAIDVVAEKGYAATTIADLTKAAGISRTTFYELFEDKEACFLAAYDAAADVLARRVEVAFESQGAWPERVRAGLVQMGIPREQISVAGRGEREPLVATEDEVAEARNRRVEITVR